MEPHRFANHEPNFDANVIQIARIKQHRKTKETSLSEEPPPLPVTECEIHRTVHLDHFHGSELLLSLSVGPGLEEQRHPTVLVLSLFQNSCTVTGMSFV